MPVHRRSLASAATLLLLVLVISGCMPLRGTTPAVCVRPNLIDAPRSSQEPINFLFLRQDPPASYLLGPRDILGIYIEGVLGGLEESPPVHFPEGSTLPPAMGFPIPVREDGTISMPLITPLRVEGLTLAQAEDAVRRAYTVSRKILQPGKDRIIVTLMRRRTYQVLVIREDATSRGVQFDRSQQGMLLGSSKRGETYTVELPAYENDILHALSESGGLPGLDAKNMVTVIRGGHPAGTNPDQVLAALLAVKDEELRAKAPPVPLETARQLAGQKSSAASRAATTDATSPQSSEDNSGWVDVETASYTQPGTAPLVDVQGLAPPALAPPPAIGPQARILELLPMASNVLTIPLRAAPGEPLPLLEPEDILLHTGDVVFIEARDAEVFYTGGLLAGGQHQIPRDYDLDVLGAISMAGGSIAATAGASGGGFGGVGRGGGGGLCPPTQITVVRMLNGYPMTIRTNLKRAIVNPSERILIQPNDIVMLEYTPTELMLNMVLNNLQFNYFLNDFGGN